MTLNVKFVSDWCPTIVLLLLVFLKVGLVNYFIAMSDPRFARLKTDPRFRRPKKKQQKVVIDERFKSVFDQAKSKKGKEMARCMSSL